MAWTPGDVSGSQTLTDSDHIYATHIDELRTAIDTLNAGGGGGGGGVSLSANNTWTGKQTFNAGALIDLGSQVFDVRGFGVVADGKTVSDVAMSASSATLTSATAGFTSGITGKVVVVQGAASGGRALIATATYVSATQITLSAAATLTVTNATIYWGTDNTTNLQTAFSAAQGLGWIELPAGIVVAPSNFMTLGPNVGLRGKGMNVSTLVTGIDATGDNQIFRDFTLDVSNIESYSGISTHGAYKSFERVRVLNWSNFGIIFVYDTSTSRPPQHGYIDKCEFENNGLGSVTGGSVITEGGYFDLHITRSYFGNSENGGCFFEAYTASSTVGAGQNVGLYIEGNEITGAFAKDSYVLGQGIKITNNRMASGLAFTSSVGDDLGGYFTSRDIEFAGNTMLPNAHNGFDTWLTLAANAAGAGYTSDTLEDVRIHHNHFDSSEIHIQAYNTTANYFKGIQINHNTFNDSSSSDIQFQNNYLTGQAVTFERLSIRGNDFKNWRSSGAGGWPAILISSSGSTALTTFTVVDITSNSFGPSRSGANQALYLQANSGGTLTGTVNLAINDLNGNTVTSDTAGILASGLGITTLGLNISGAPQTTLDLGGGEGNVFTAATMALGYSTTGQYRHFVHTRHNSGSTSLNAVDIYTSDGTAAGVFPTNAVHGLTITQGRVGIAGRTSPSYELDVNGTGAFTGFIMTTSPASGKVLTSDSSGNGTWATPGAVWGGITGTLSSQSDLNTALGGKLSLTGGTLTGSLNIDLENSGFGIDNITTPRLGFVKQAGNNPKLVSDSGNPIILAQSNQTGVLTSISTATITELARFTTTGLSVGTGANPTAGVHAPASTTSAASLRVPSGTAPTSPNSGDVWFDGTHIQFRNGSTTDQLDNQTSGFVSVSFATLTKFK